MLKCHVVSGCGVLERWGKNSPFPDFSFEIGGVWCEGGMFECRYPGCGSSFKNARGLSAHEPQCRKRAAKAPYGRVASMKRSRAGNYVF